MSLDWHVSTTASLSTDVSYRHIAVPVGSWKVVNTGDGYTPGPVAATSTDGAGASYDALNVSIGFNRTP